MLLRYVSEAATYTIQGSRPHPQGLPSTRDGPRASSDSNPGAHTLSQRVLYGPLRACTGAWRGLVWGRGRGPYARKRRG
jgi:hypothetical protein